MHHRYFPLSDGYWRDLNRKEPQKSELQTAPFFIALENDKKGALFYAARRANSLDISLVEQYRYFTESVTTDVVNAYTCLNNLTGSLHRRTV